MTRAAQAGLSIGIGLALAPVCLVVMPYVVWVGVVLAAVVGALP